MKLNKPDHRRKIHKGIKNSWKEMLISKYSATKWEEIHCIQVDE